MLPTRFSLARSHPTAPNAVFGPGNSLPCDDRASTISEANYFDIGYWVVGTTPATADADFALVTAAWKALGWSTETDRASRPRACYCRTPDGYGLTVQYSVDGHLSLSGSTPAFPLEPAEHDAWPESIAHPLARPAREPGAGD